MGFLSIDRKLFNHWIWNIKEPYDKRSAWIDLIQMATHTEHMGNNYKGEVAVLKRGEIHTSMLYLSKRWMWDRRKVKRFLSVLQMDGMLSFSSTTNGSTGGTVITLENYNKYQLGGTTNSTADSITDAQPMYNERTYQNKGINKDNKGIIINSHRNRKIGDQLPGDTLDEKLASWNRETHYKEPKSDKNQSEGIWSLSDEQLKILRGEL